MAETLKSANAVIGIDIGKNSFHLVGATARANPTGIQPRRNFTKRGGTRLLSFPDDRRHVGRVLVRIGLRDRVGDLAGLGQLRGHRG
jgi:hypothetical protein